MARLRGDGPIQRKDVIRFRRRLRFRDLKGQLLVMEKWPSRRGKKQTENQKAWTDDFTVSAKASKNADPCGYLQAFELAKQPFANGRYYRDILHTAYHGNLVNSTGVHPHDRLVFRESPAGPDAEPFKVTTPTVCVYRDAVESLSNGVNKILTPNQLYWDNNNFWDPTSHPTRLTFKAAGLYLVGFECVFSAVSGAQRQTKILFNGSLAQIRDFRHSSNNAALEATASGIWYFNPNEYMEAQVYANAASVTAQIRAFWAVGITPEAIL
jgi:hypothetical protein